MNVIRRLGPTAYPQVLEQMRLHVAGRRSNRAASDDELWLTEHEPVFTLGFASRLEHLLDAGEIPVIATERGGQVTYHGPGQMVAYLLLDLRRRRLGVRQLVERLEEGIIRCLGDYGVAGLRKPGAPGIYVQPRLPKGPELAKIASIGLKVSSGLTWHGVALNGAMDLSPFERIDPCGFPGLQMTDLRSEAGTHLADAAWMHTLGDRLADSLIAAIEG